MAEEEKLDLESSMKELRNVVDNIDNLSLDDIKKEINLAYKLGASPETSSGLEANPSYAAELENILSTLINKSNELKKSAENIVTTDLKNIEEQQIQPVEEKTIPKPQVDITPEEERLEDANSAGYEISEEDLNNIQLEEPVKESEDIPVVKHSESTADFTPNEEIGRVIPKPVKEEPVEEMPKQVPVGSNSHPVEEEKKESIVIDEPSEEKMDIIVDDKKKEAETDENAKKEEAILEEINDIFTAKPFDGDDDETVESTPDENNDTATETLDIQTKDDVEKERIKKLDEEYSAPKDVDLHNVKSVSRKKISDILKSLSKLDTSHVDVEKIEMFDFNLDDNDLRKSYLTTRNDMISAPKISRIALLMSGHYEEIAAYGNSDQIGVERVIFSDNHRFVDKERILLESIHAHVNYVSYAKEKPDFDTWARNIKLPDMMSLYFGVYDANSTGPNHYIFDCPYCGTELDVNKRNPELTVGVPKEFDMKSDELEKFITNKDLMNMDSTPLAKWAETKVIRKMLPNSCIIVDFAVPTVYDYLETITTLERINQRDMGGRLNLSILDDFNIDPSQVEDEESLIEDFNRIQMYIYIKDIGIPTKVGDGNKYRYIKLTNKADIIEHINALDADDYNELLSGEAINDLITKTSTRYYLTDCKCSNEKCGKNIKFVSINPKQIFFFKIGEGRRKRLMR